MTVIVRLPLFHVECVWASVCAGAVSQDLFVLETVCLSMRRLWCVREAISVHSICSMRALCEFTFHAVDVWHALFYPVLSLARKCCAYFGNAWRNREGRVRKQVKDGEKMTVF